MWINAGLIGFNRPTCYTWFKLMSWLLEATFNQKQQFQLDQIVTYTVFNKTKIFFPHCLKIRSLNTLRPICLYIIWESPHDDVMWFCKLLIWNFWILRQHLKHVLSKGMGKTFNILLKEVCKRTPKTTQSETIQQNTTTGKLI